MGVALLEIGIGTSHAEIAETRDRHYRGQVHKMVEPFRKRDKPEADWLSEHGSAEDDGPL